MLENLRCGHGAALFYWTWTEDGIIRDENRLPFVGGLMLLVVIVNGGTFIWACFQNDSMLSRLKRILGDYSDLG